MVLLFHFPSNIHQFVLAMRNNLSTKESYFDQKGILHCDIFVHIICFRLQRVKDEMEKRRQQYLGSLDVNDDGLDFVKPLDHEMFQTALAAAKLIISANAARDSEQLKHHHHCNGQHQQKLLVNNSVYEEPIKSAESRS